MSNQILVLWIPIAVIIAASALLYTERDTIAIGLILLGLGLEGFVNLRLLGSNGPTDEFYLMVLKKSRDIGFRVVYFMIIVLIIVHYVYRPLFTDFVLITLLYTAYAATTLGTIFFMIKKK